MLQPTADRLRQRCRLAVAACLALAIPALASHPAAGADGRKKDRLSTKKIQDKALSKRTGIPLSAVGYLVVDAATGKVVAQHQPKTLFTPASAIKVPTTVAALGILGGDYRFATRLLRTGTVRGGVLHGDLILVGGGDPVLTTDDYRDFVEALRAAGITKIKGRFLFDESLFPAAPYIEPTHAQTVAYNPGVSPLSLNFNRVKLKWTRGKEPDEVEAAAYSKTDNIELKVDLLNFGMAKPRQDGPHGLILQKDGEGFRWLLTRRARRKGEIWLPIRRPGYHAAHVFQKFAAMNGVLLPEPKPGKAPGKARLVHRHLSQPLPRIAHKVLRYSNNMAAEMLGLAAGSKLTGTGLTIKESSAVLAAWVKSQARGTSWEGYEVINHSGLTQDTRVSPVQMVAILRYAAGRRFGNSTYMRLLRPYFVGGGRRERRFPRHIRVLAKTGTINYVRALAGYLTTRSKRKLIFALFISDLNLQEAAAKNGRRYKAMRPRRWNWRARRMQRGIVRRWALEY